ncbi:protein EPIDERMAL PATTERNING FACTOR 2 isoform X2 [Mercurialis annua]|uniref:protein EPIDERMAL PATTERNING FACTOR 2 isoform X2 n=1 Tax=Mercurialis annua TaxID=3986 RepID=UPI0021608391|nr:protein EPIDERMAL PATTERNING FACTOR 2 isoform X2 [Mercurialis annua]
MKSSFESGAHKCMRLLLIFMALIVGKEALRPHHYISVRIGKEVASSKNEEARDQELGMELYPTGSSLPDCSHACGPCFPCKRVMVSFKCSIGESCPIVYRCMCKGKYYHVPSA